MTFKVGSMSVVKESNDSLFCLLFAKPQLKMALIIAFIVGTILNLINQGHLLSALDKVNWVNIVLTYCVPFCVATFSSALSTTKHKKKLQVIEENKQICENNYLDYIQAQLTIFEQHYHEGNAQSKKVIAEFIMCVENIFALSPMENSEAVEVALDKATAYLAQDNTIQAMAILNELVLSFADNSTQRLASHKQQVALLSDQRSQLITTFKKAN